MDADELQHWAGRVITAKKNPSQDFVRGVWALTNALTNAVDPPDPNVMIPVPHMRVRCRTRPCDLVVLRVGSLGKGVTVWTEVLPHDGWGKTKGFHRGDKRRRRMKLSTWRRWVRGGKILDSESQGGTLQVVKRAEITTTPVTPAGGSHGALQESEA